MSLDSIERIIAQIKNMKDRLSALETREQKKTLYLYSTPKTSSLWDGDSHSTEPVTALNLITTFGIPANIKAVLIQVYARDSATLGTTTMFFSVGPSRTYNYAIDLRPIGGDVWTSMTAPLAVDEFGNIFYQIAASGTNTLDVFIHILGYWT